MSQLSFFSAESVPPSPLDVEGLLAGPAHLVRRGGQTRLSVLVDAEWRAAALADALAVRQLDPEQSAAGPDGGGFVVRTAFTAALTPLALRWTAGAVKRPPAGFAFDGCRLRWWCLAAGDYEGSGYTLGLGRGDELTWPAVGAALAAAGVPATLVRARGSGPVYRIVGSRRLARLRELVGAPPPEAPRNAWPPAGR